MIVQNRNEYFNKPNMNDLEIHTNTTPTTQNTQTAQVPPLPNMPMPNRQMAALGTTQKSPITGLTRTESALLSPDEQVIARRT